LIGGSETCISSKILRIRLRGYRTLRRHRGARAADAARVNQFPVSGSTTSRHNSIIDSYQVGLSGHAGGKPYRGKGHLIAASRRNVLSSYKQRVQCNTTALVNKQLLTERCSSGPRSEWALSGDEFTTSSIASTHASASKFGFFSKWETAT
jgi:hypothetical protein